MQLFVIVGCHELPYKCLTLWASDLQWFGHLSELIGFVASLAYC